jgi:hypothetical protein
VIEGKKVKHFLEKKPQNMKFTGLRINSKIFPPHISLKILISTTNKQFVLTNLISGCASSIALMSVVPDRGTPPIKMRGMSLWYSYFLLSAPATNCYKIRIKVSLNHILCLELRYTLTVLGTITLSGALHVWSTRL